MFGSVSTIVPILFIREPISFKISRASILSPNCFYKNISNLTNISYLTEANHSRKCPPERSRSFTSLSVAKKLKAALLECRYFLFLLHCMFLLVYHKLVLKFEKLGLHMYCHYILL